MAPERRSTDKEEPPNNSPLRTIMIPTPPLELDEPLDMSCVTQLTEQLGIRIPREDDELTSLSWLQDKNLLKNLRVVGASTAEQGTVSDSPTSDYMDESSENADGSQTSGDVPYNPKVHLNSKPPFSFSCLIFMAIESAPHKSLPVKDIYSWILRHFPYFLNAPTGWKNSVRHNLSLNKCFRKVDKDRGQSIGKGSLWCIDSDYRPNLIQAMRKTPYHPLHYQMFATASSPANSPSQDSSTEESAVSRANINLPNPDLFPYLSKRLAASSINDEVDAAATMLALKNGPRYSMPAKGFILVADEGQRRKLRKRRVRCFSPTRREDAEPSVPVITTSPSEDHTYSANSSNSSPNSGRSDSSIDEAFSDGSVTDSGHTDSLASSCDTTSESEEEFQHAHDGLRNSKWNLYTSKAEDSTSRVRRKRSHDYNERLKIVEGADALLNLAGIKTSRSSASSASSISSKNSGRNRSTSSKNSAGIKTSRSSASSASSTSSKNSARNSNATSTSTISSKSSKNSARNSIATSNNAVSNTSSNTSAACETPHQPRLPAKKRIKQEFKER